MVLALLNQFAAGLPSSVNVLTAGVELLDALELVGDDEELLLVTVLQTPALVCAPSIFNESIFAKPSAVNAESFKILLPCTKSISTIAACQFVQAPVAGNGRV